MENVTRAELRELIGLLRIKAAQYNDKEIASIAQRLIPVHNMGLPQLGELVHVQCLSDWLISSKYRTLLNASAALNWDRNTLGKLLKDKEMKNHIVLNDNIFRRYEKSVHNGKSPR